MPPMLPGDSGVCCIPDVTDLITRGRIHSAASRLYLGRRSGGPDLSNAVCGGAVRSRRRSEEVHSRAIHSWAPCSNLAPHFHVSASGSSTASFIQSFTRDRHVLNRPRGVVLRSGTRTSMSTRFAALLASPPPRLTVASCLGRGYDDGGAAQLPGAFRVARSPPPRLSPVVTAPGGNGRRSLRRRAALGVDVDES